MKTAISIFTSTAFLIWIGAICGHILSLYSKDFVGTKPFLERMFPGKSSTFYFRVDFLILPVIGAFLAFILLEPSNIKSSVFAGLSWSGTLLALLKSSTEKNSQ